MLEWARWPKNLDLFETMMQRLILHRKRAKQAIGSRGDQVRIYAAYFKLAHVSAGSYSRRGGRATKPPTT